MNPPGKETPACDAPEQKEVLIVTLIAVVVFFA